MSVPLAAVLLGTGLLVGVLIGAVGVGGVLLVPALTYIGGMEIHVAIASAMVAYFFAGGVGAIQFARHGSIRWIDAAWLTAGAMPGAFVGAAAISVVPAFALELLIAILIIASALNSLRGRGPLGGVPRTPAKSALIVIGMVTGIGSSMSGTGGPLLLMPILLWLHVPVLAAVGLSQVIQVPIAAFATTGNILYGAIDYPVAAALAVLLMVGVWFGARIAHRVSSLALKRFVSRLLLGVGLMMLVRVALYAVGWTSP
ncbi:MAG: sulfite exporter TauE/SafE family protein [Thiotrichales bacterium]|nr:sulfite exporter TauE/SafE family protein [Thiotrichales bacterium]